VTQASARTTNNDPQQPTVGEKIDSRQRFKKVLLGGILVLLMAFGLSSLLHVIPPRSSTHTSIHMCRRRIVRFVKKHNHLPKNLRELEEIAGFSNSIQDGWGEPVVFKVEGDEIHLLSFGSDKQEGGTGEARDMIGVFSIRKADGTWADEISTEEWISW
tara:strand:- start:1988 stop:2464 length:477 start_codon:yes stop_codon:yes gene_type:complete